MEIVIVVCLMMVVILLLSEKIVIRKIVYKKEEGTVLVDELPDIMGKPKIREFKFITEIPKKKEADEAEFDPADLDIEYDENENTGIQIPNEELERIFTNKPDLADEQEDWNQFGEPDEDFAMGVTFEEINSAGTMLKKKKLEPSEKKTVKEFVRKIQGTDLYNLLENSIEDASRKIAELLDNSLSNERSEPSLYKNQDIEDFDIEAFL